MKISILNKDIHGTMYNEYYDSYIIETVTQLINEEMEYDLLI